MAQEFSILCIIIVSRKINAWYFLFGLLVQLCHGPFYFIWIPNIILVAEGIVICRPALFQDLVEGSRAAKVLPFLP